jgi:hypothetical protein
MTLAAAKVRCQYSFLKEKMSTHSHLKEEVKGADEKSQAW